MTTHDALHTVVNAAFRYYGGIGNTEIEILRNRMSSPEFIVGVDPGRNTGVGILRASDDSVIGFYTKDFYSVQSLIDKCFPTRSQALVFVEVSPAVRIGHRADLDEQTRDKMLVNTGGVRREAMLLAGAIRRMGFDVREVSPLKKEKWTDEEFELFAGSTRKANSHEKDAVRLAYFYKHKLAEGK